MSASVSFSNNIGELVFQQCLIGIDDQYQWNGSVVDHNKVITVTGYLYRQDSVIDSEMFEDILDNTLDSTGTFYSALRAKAGDLVLPWVTLSNIKLQDISIGDNSWIDAVEVQATFLDDTPDDNRYTISFFDLTVHHPQILLPIPQRQIIDRFVTMPRIDSADSPNTFTDDVAFGPIRSRMTHLMMEIGIAGTILIEEIPGLDNDVVVPPIVLPNHHIEKRIAYLTDILAQRRSSSYATVGDPGSGASGLIGYPRVFDMVDVMPEIAPELPIRKMFVAESSANWDVEQGTVSINVLMLTQPQDWT